MKVVRSPHYSAARAWDAQLLAAFGDATVRLHWTDQPYRWHINDGEEVFAVMDGTVEMHYREPGGSEQMVTLHPGDIFCAAAGDAHSAHPRGPARILVIERAGSE